MTKKEYVGWIGDGFEVILDHSQPVIKCKNCIYCTRTHYCMRLYEWDEDKWFSVEPEDFCSLGERRDDEE